MVACTNKDNSHFFYLLDNQLEIQLSPKSTVYTRMIAFYHWLVHIIELASTRTMLQLEDIFGLKIMKFTIL